jgi:hypothetical protein
MRCRGGDSGAEPQPASAQADEDKRRDGARRRVRRREQSNRSGTRKDLGCGRREDDGKLGRGRREDDGKLGRGCRKDDDELGRCNSDKSSGGEGRMTTSSGVTARRRQDKSLGSAAKMTSQRSRGVLAVPQQGGRREIERGSAGRRARRRRTSRTTADVDGERRSVFEIYRTGFSWRRKELTRGFS